jgi:hypothetical protein
MYFEREVTEAPEAQMESTRSFIHTSFEYLSLHPVEVFAAADDDALAFRLAG